MRKRKRQSVATPVEGGGPAAGAEQASRSERKRHAHRLQALGQRLTELDDRTLASLSLPEALVTAIVDYRRFASHGAKRRQLHYIGRLMRELDAEPVQTALDRLDGASARDRYAFHQLERWRDRLLDPNDGEALTAFVAAHPGVDVQQLRHHVERAREAGPEDRQRTAYRALFRFLRDDAHPA